MVPSGRWSSSSALCGGWGLVVARCLGARGFCWQCAGGARPRCGVGHGGFAAVGGRARCRVHVQHPWPPLGGRPSSLGGGLWPPLWGVALLLFWWGVCWVRPFRRVLPLWGGLWWLWWVVCDLYSGCEHICSVLFFVFCLVLLGIRWMPWHQELMKDVAACDMPRGAGERALLSEGVRMGEPNLGCAGLPSSERV